VLSSVGLMLNVNSSLAGVRMNEWFRKWLVIGRNHHVKNWKLSRDAI